jgi:hypothetical protein
VAVVGTFTAATWGYALVSLRMHRQIFVASAVATGVLLVLASTLAATSGAKGGALALAITELGISVLYGAAVVRALPAVRLPVKGIACIAVATALAAGAAILIDLSPAVDALVAAIVYIVALLALGRYVAAAFAQGPGSPFGLLRRND